MFVGNVSDQQRMTSLIFSHVETALTDLDHDRCVRFPDESAARAQPSEYGVEIFFGAAQRPFAPAAREFLI
jgi:hypothetical protein